MTLTKVDFYLLLKISAKWRKTTGIMLRNSKWVRAGTIAIFESHRGNIKSHTWFLSHHDTPSSPNYYQLKLAKLFGSGSGDFQSWVTVIFRNQKCSNCRASWWVIKLTGNLINIRLTLHLLFAKFFLIWALTDSWMFLLRAVSPAILKQRQRRFFRGFLGHPDTGSKLLSREGSSCPFPGWEAGLLLPSQAAYSCTACLNMQKLPPGPTVLLYPAPSQDTATPSGLTSLLGSRFFPSWPQVLQYWNP